MPEVSFERNITPLFRPVDIEHTKVHTVELAGYAFMSNPDNAEGVLATLSPRDGKPPMMPPGGPYWTADQLALFGQWRQDGCQP